MILALLFYGLLDNYILIILGLVACFRASSKKSYLGWIVAAVLLNSIHFIGAFILFKRTPGATISDRTIVSLVCSVILLIIFILVSSRAYKKAIAKKDNEQNRQEFVSQENKYICTECGTTNAGWYQVCPHCGAVGKMKKNDTVRKDESTRIKVVPNICPYCGAKLTGEEKYCTNCGNKLNYSPNITN